MQSFFGDKVWRAILPMNEQRTLNSFGGGGGWWHHYRCSTVGIGRVMVGVGVESRGSRTPNGSDLLVICMKWTAQALS